MDSHFVILKVINLGFDCLFLFAFLAIFDATSTRKKDKSQ